MKSSRHTLALSLRATALFLGLAVLPAVGAAQASEPTDAANEPSVFEAHIETMVRVLERFEDRVAARPDEVRDRDLRDLHQHLIAVYGHAVRAEEPLAVRERLRELVGVVERAIDGDAIRLGEARDHSTATSEKAFAPGTGTILGEVTANGSPTFSADIVLYDSAGLEFATASATSDGFFVFSDLPPGEYYAWIEDWDLVPELFDDVECPSDPPFGCGSPGEPISIVADDIVPINIELGSGSTLSAIVRVADSEAVLWAELRLYDSEGDFVDSSNISSSPAITSLAAGTYFAVADSDGYNRQLYSGIDCPHPCDVTAGTPIIVGRSVNHGPIEFLVPPLGRITGRVTNSAGVPIPFAAVRAVGTSTTTGGEFASADAQGLYAIEGLRAGSYIVRAFTYGSHLAEVYHEQPCSTSDEYDCELSSASAVTVATGETTGDIDFTLEPLGRISGAVTTDDWSGLLISGSVTVWRSTGSTVEYYESQSVRRDGFFMTGPLEAGDYWITADAPEYVRQIYQGVDCDQDRTLDQCAGATVSPLVVRSGRVNTGIDFVLRRASVITGRVTAESTGLALDHAAVRLRSEDASIDRLAFSDRNFGYYHIPELEPGTYYLWIDRAGEFQPEVYDGLACLDPCEVLEGTPIEITSYGSIVSGIDFALRRLGSITGSVHSANDGQPIAGANIRIQFVGGSVISSPYPSTVTDETGYYSIPALRPDSPYLLSVWPSSIKGAYVPLAYPETSCQLRENGDWDCRDLGDAVTTALDSVLEDIDFALYPVTVYIDGFETGDVTSWSAATGAD